MRCNKTNGYLILTYEMKFNFYSCERIMQYLSISYDQMVKIALSDEIAYALPLDSNYHDDMFTIMGHN